MGYAYLNQVYITNVINSDTAKYKRMWERVPSQIVRLELDTRPCTTPIQSRLPFLELAAQYANIEPGVTAVF